VRAARCLLVPAGAGAAFGALIQAGPHVVPGAPHWLFHLGAPWLAVAFIAGFARRGRREATAAGAAALAAAVVGYYVARIGILGSGAVAYSARMTVAWSAAALPLGAAFGWAGSEARARALWAPATIGGALCGEALLLLITHGAAATLLAELVTGAAVPAASSRAPARRRALALTAAGAGAALLAAGLLRQVMRAHGWQGP
jgi:hypothetical protein